MYNFYNRYSFKLLNYLFQITKPSLELVTYRVNNLEKKSSCERSSDILILVKLVETPRKFIIAELSIRKLGSSSVLIIRLFEFTRPFL